MLYVTRYLPPSFKPLLTVVTSVFLDYLTRANTSIDIDVEKYKRHKGGTSIVIEDA